MSVNLDHINCESASWAAKRIRELHPLPAQRLADMKPKDADAWLIELHAKIDDYLGVIGAFRRPGRAWVDVQLASLRWVGQWIDNCPTEAAVACAYWHEEPVIAAGIGLRASVEAATAHQARLEAGDLLAVLGGDW